MCASTAGNGGGDVKGAKGGWEIVVVVIILTFNG